MNFKKFIILLVLLCILNMSFVSASWHSDTPYADGTCKLFSIYCPGGYKNGGEIAHEDEVFISTNPSVMPYHSIVVREIDDESIAQIYEDYDIEDSYDDGNFKAYKLEEGIVGKMTIAIYSDEDYDYILKFEHKGCEYDDNQFEDDIDMLEEIADSIDHN